MPRRTLLSLEERVKTDAFSEDGLTPANIAKRIKRIVHVVETYPSSPREYGKQLFTQENKNLSGRDRRVLVLYASKQGSSAAQLRNIPDLPISKRRVKQILSAQEHLRSCNFKRAPSLAACHKNHQLNTLRLWHAWNPQQWGRAICSDEKTFNLDGSDGFKYHWYDSQKAARFPSRR